MRLQLFVVLLACVFLVVDCTTFNPLIAHAQSTARDAPQFPRVVNDTSNQYLPFVLSVQSQESDINIFRNLQLRPDPTTPGAFLVVVDATSPVLALSMRKQVLYSETRNRPTDKGQVGALRNASTGNTHNLNLREFVFRNLTGSSTSFQQSYNKWTLTGAGYDSGYALDTTPVQEEFSGFLLCKRGTSQDTYYQVLHVRNPYGGGFANVPGCEYIVFFEALLRPQISQICGQYCTT